MSVAVFTCSRSLNDNLPPRHVRWRAAGTATAAAATSTPTTLVRVGRGISKPGQSTSTRRGGGSTPGGSVKGPDSGSSRSTGVRKQP